MTSPCRASALAAPRYFRWVAGGGCPAPGPLGSGRARLVHPALQGMDSLHVGRPFRPRHAPAAAIRRGHVETLPGHNVPDALPLSGSMTRRPLPSTGSPGTGSPASQVLRGAPTPRRPSRRAPFPSPGGTALASLSSLARPAGTLRGTSPGFGVRSPDRSPPDRGGEVSQVPGVPTDARAPFSDPGGTLAPGHQAPRCCLPLFGRRRLPRPNDFGAQ
jgi:hypothetical protein